MLMAHQGDVWKPAIAATRLMILTRWRRGEVLGLRWSEIDLAKANCTTARLSDTKTGASLRPLSLLACAVIPFAAKEWRSGGPKSIWRSDVGYRKMWLKLAMPTKSGP